MNLYFIAIIDTNNDIIEKNVANNPAIFLLGKCNDLSRWNGKNNLIHIKNFIFVINIF